MTITRLLSRLALPALAFLCSAPAHAAPTSRPPNIVLILSDDHSVPNLGCYGDPDARTPHLDRFAAEGLRFDRAYTSAPQCVPSRAALLTGHSPLAVGMSRFSAALAADVPIFPDALQDAGYFTGAIGRNFHLDGAVNPDPASLAANARLGLPSVARRFDFVQVNRRGDSHPVHETARRFFAARGDDADRPYFLWANFHQPHRRWDSARTSPDRPDPASLHLPPDFPDVPSVREDYADFHTILQSLDDDFARLLAVIEERGDPAHTLIVFMGDNGASLLRGKGTLYDRGTHVPFLVRWPGVVAPGTSTDALVAGEDLAPTFLAAAGLPVPASLPGTSILPLLHGRPQPQPRDAVFAARTAHGYSLPRTAIAFDLARSITTATHRLIYNVTWDRRFAPVDIEDYEVPFWADLRERHERGEIPEPFASLYFSPERPLFELYDLTSDPHELHNLAGRPDQAELETELRHRLAEWMIEQRDYVPLPSHSHSR